MRVLALDYQGTPHRWISKDDAIVYHAKKLVAWQLEDDKEKIVYRGGINKITGLQSKIYSAPIIAVKRTEAAAIRRMNSVPALTNKELFRRDHFMCAYCGKIFKDLKLTRDHIIPRSKGGADKWMNVVTACGKCNRKKDDNLLEDCDMELLYLPYTPNRAEALILENRNILTCQMQFLKAYLPEHSRVLKHFE